MSTAKTEDEVGTTRVALGSVVNVRSLPTRGVTRIEIEIPVESHVEATSLLFGKDVFVVVAATLPPGTRYGISDGIPPRLSPKSPAAVPSSSRTSAASSLATKAASGRTTGPTAPLRGGLGRVEDTMDIVRWLGARCTEEAFQLWIGERTEAGAAAAVRTTCGVDTRAAISGDPAARAIFLSKIYRPFTATLRQPFERDSVPVEDETENHPLQAGLRELSRGG